MPLHATTSLTYKHHKVLIDTAIVPLIKALWKLGIETTGSCKARCSFSHIHKRHKNGQAIYGKDCNNRIWIAFANSKSFERLYNILGEWSKSNGDDRDDETMYAKMGCDRFIGASYRPYGFPPGNWEHHFLLSNEGVHRKVDVDKGYWIEVDCKKNDFILQPQINFPQLHLPYVIDKLNSALPKKKKQ